MAREYTFNVDGELFRGTTASAKAQFEALHVAMRTALVAMLDDSEHSEMALVGYFARVSFDDIEKLQTLLVDGHVKRAEDDVPVALNLFADRPEQYYLVIYNVLRENLGGFWRLRRPQSGEAPEGSNS